VWFCSGRHAHLVLYYVEPLFLSALAAAIFKSPTREVEERKFLPSKSSGVSPISSLPCHVDKVVCQGCNPIAIAAMFEPLVLVLVI
jgi:hypothetical protein